IYSRGPRRRLPVGQPPPAVDRYALGIAVFSALTFAAILVLTCSVVALSALFLRSESRWTELASLLGTGGLVVSPLATPTQLSAFTSSLQPEPPTSTPAPVEPAATLPMEPTITPVVVSPLEQPPLEDVPTAPEAAAPPLQLSPEEYGYQTMLLQRVESASGAINAVANLVSQPLIGDPNWQAQIVAQIDLVEQANAEIAGMPPPPVLSMAYSTVASNINLCLAALFTIEEATRVNDPNGLQLGAANLYNCRPGLENAKSQLNGVPMP
nr:hypothetical protein [Caldilineaceae bacterium]